MGCFFRRNKCFTLVPLHTQLIRQNYGDFVLKIGLTGGIGSGKSTAAKYFTQLNIPVVDADEIVHKLLTTNTIIYNKIISHFGQNYSTYKNTIDRKKLRQLVFSNKEERLWLEKLLQPKVRTEITKHITKFHAPYCIISVPLLFETKYPPTVDRILVIDCLQKTQIMRTRKRNHYTIKQIKAIIANQASRKTRLKQADDIIYNVDNLYNFKKQIKKLHYYYLSLVRKCDIMKK